ncbi:MAG: response regulator [Chloroflexi bacterium]|nr:response regulator [Chloroflexota bacterium]
MPKTILIADDEEMIRGLVAATLANEGRYRLLQAKNGGQALEIARQEKPELVLLDVKMPVMDGFEVCSHLKADPQTREIRIYILSALTQESDREKGLAVGADGYFTKPFSPLALLEKVTEILGV